MVWFFFNKYTFGLLNPRFCIWGGFNQPQMENSIFSLQLGICNANCMHCSTPLYIRDLNILRSGDPWGPWSQSPSPNPMDTEGLYEGGPPKTWNLFIKSWVFILTCLNFSHLQNTLHLMQYTYQDFFSTAQNSFWTCWFWCLLQLLLFFVLFLPHWQNVSLWRLFSSGETNKKVTQDELG